MKHGLSYISLAWVYFSFLTRKNNVFDTYSQTRVWCFLFEWNILIMTEYYAPKNAPRFNSINHFENCFSFRTLIIKDVTLATYCHTEWTHRWLLPKHRWRPWHFILIFSPISTASISRSNFIINYYFALILSSVTGLVLLTCMSSGVTRKRESTGKMIHHRLPNPGFLRSCQKSNHKRFTLNNNDSHLKQIEVAKHKFLFHKIPVIDVNLLFLRGDLHLGQLLLSVCFKE